MDEQQPLSGKSGIGAVPMQPAEPVQFVGQPPEQERLLAKQAAASLNGPAAVDPEALKGRFTMPLLMSVAAAACGSSAIFGYNIGSINPPADAIKIFLNESHAYMTGSTLNKSDMNWIWSAVVSLFPFGGIFGGILCGFVADRFGRKRAMMYNNFFCFVAAIFMASSKYANLYPLLMLGRFIIGFNCGLNSGLAPMYLMEIAPINLRGMLGSVNQLMVTVFIMLASIIGLPMILGNEWGWPALLALTVIPAIWQIIAFVLPFCPESPKYLLVVKNDRMEAEKALKLLRQKVDVSAELKVMQDEADKAAQAPKVRFVSMLSQASLRWPLTIAVMMMLAQQFSGINAAFYFSNQIFEGAANLEGYAPKYATLGMCIVNVIMTVVSTAIVDRAGRRILLLAGMAGMWLASILIVICLAVVDSYHKESTDVNMRAAAYASIPLMYLFVIAFATGPGAIPWFYVNELFSQGAKGHANAVAVMTNWGANFIVGLAFTPWADLVGPYAFLAFTGALTVCWIFTFLFAPETKGRQLEDVQDELRRKAPPGCR